MRQAADCNGGRALKKILVVDDNAVERAILSKLLNEDYIVITAVNGREAGTYLGASMRASPQLFWILLCRK